MKKLIFLIAVIGSLSSCSIQPSETYENGQYKSFSTMLNKCKGTTKVIGISEVDGSWAECKINIAVIDSTSTIYECRIGGNLGLSIGDTIKTE